MSRWGFRLNDSKDFLIDFPVPTFLTTSFSFLLFRRRVLCSQCLALFTDFTVLITLEFFYFNYFFNVQSPTEFRYPLFKVIPFYEIVV